MGAKSTLPINAMTGGSMVQQPTSQTPQYPSIRGPVPTTDAGTPPLTATADANGWQPGVPLDNFYGNQGFTPQSQAPGLLPAAPQSPPQMAGAPAAATPNQQTRPGGNPNACPTCGK